MFRERDLKLFTGAIVFLSEPRDILAQIGETVRFECDYEGSQNTAAWEINGYLFATFSVLPPKHRADIAGLNIYDIDRSMDGNVYRCVVDSYYSKRGYLNISQGMNVYVFYRMSNCFSYA